MKVKYNEFLALSYSDLFDFPLNSKELSFWAISRDNCVGEDQTNYYKAAVKFKNGYYFFGGRKQLLQIREERQEISRVKLIKLERLINIIKKVPSVEAIFLTGSVAMMNAKEEADLDLMIITSTNSLWITRIFVVGILKLGRIYRTRSVSNSLFIKDKFCTNLFLDLNHLEVQEKNLYSAHEVLQAKCLYDRGRIEAMWLEMNRWTEEFLPKAYVGRTAQAETKANSNTRNSFLLSRLALVLPEIIAFILQYVYMKRRITNERIGWGFAFFHPNDLSETILKRYDTRLKKRIAGF